MDQNYSDALSSEFSDLSDKHPSTTTISTVAVQAGKAKIVLAILRSHDWIRVRIQQMEPDLMDVGSTLEEAKALRREHDELLMKLNLKQKDVTELLTQADDLATQNKSYQEVYAAMAESLGEAWRDLNKQLEYRKMLLDQSIAFHESAQQFSYHMEAAQDKFSRLGPAHDVETARHILQQHQELKKNILEASMLTLQEGQTLLDRIRQMGMHADVQNRHATTAACYGIEHLLELLQDRRRRLEELWLERKIKLEQMLQLLLLDQEVNKVADWFHNIGDVYLEKKDLGESLAEVQRLQEQHVQFEHQAREIHETVLRLLRTADQLVHSAHHDAEGVRKRLLTVDEKCEDFMLRLDTRRKNLALAINFFSLAQTALSKLNEIEVQLTTTDLPRNSAALAEQHAYLSSAIVEVSTSALREGRILLERVGRENPGVQGIKQMVDLLQERCKKLEDMCKARYEAGEKSQAYNQFMDKYNNVSTWLSQIGQATLSSYRDMGTNLSSARDFLELHEKLEEDLRDKTSEMDDLMKAADTLASSGETEGAAAKKKIEGLRDQWNLVLTLTSQRIKLGMGYVIFHKKAQQLAIQMDALEQYLKIEKIDATQIPESSIKHKEVKYNEMSEHYSEVENKGRTFIDEAQRVKDDSHLETQRAVSVVEIIIHSFHERKFLITEYYEHWKVHVSTGKEFKTQWHQFIQDARKTIDWMMAEEKELFVPYIAGYLGKSLEDVKQIQAKLDRFAPTAKKAQVEVEGHLKTAELLSLKGDTKGQKDQIINELLKVHTRFQARIAEYQVLLNMTIGFYKNLDKLDKLIETTETEYRNAELPSDVTKAHLQLKEHDTNRVKVQKLIEFSHEEGEQIVVRVRQQDSEAVAKDEVQKVLQLTEGRRSQWEKAWEDQKSRLEHNLQICQFYFDLRQVHNELDELHRQLRARHGNYGSSLASVKMTSEAFKQFEMNVQVIEQKLQTFVSTAEVMIKNHPNESRRIRHEIDEAQKKWTAFHTSIGEYSGSLEKSTKFFEILEVCEGWINEAGQFLLQVGRKATECKSSADANALIDELEKFRTEGANEENQRLTDMEKIAVDLYGPVKGPNKMQFIVDRNQEILGSFLHAIDELAVLRDNLLKKEQILAEMESVVEKKAPKQPRFVIPLQNAEIREGQRFTFECRLECDTQSPKIEWYKDSMLINTPDYQTSFKDGLCMLTIEETFSEDSAKWTCKAITENGTAETSCMLKVKETHKKIIPPDFSKHLSAIDAPEGTQVVFECHVTGIPSPTISWYKDDASIDSSPEYVITQINGTCCLKIRKVTPEYSGRYMCKANNPGGESSSSAQLNVICVRKPSISSPLKDVSVQEGKGVKLECQYTGEPAPQVQWLKNDRSVMPSTIFKITVESTSTTLEIREVFPEDSGTYTVIIRNIGGEVRTSCMVTIEGVYSTGEELHEPMKPKFLQHLQNKEVQEGSRARLDCVIVGYPEPEVIWFHNEKPVRESKDFQLLFEGDRCSLVIREVYLEDSGEYHCMARNQHGQADSRTRLIVEPLSELSDVSTGVPADVVPPKFTQLLKDIESNEGERVIFECRVIGHPTPAIKWYRGRQEIQHSADFQISSSRELHTLIIPEVFKEDAGNFMIKATNIAGEAKCYASLIVKQLSDKHVMKTRLVESSHTMQTSIIVGHRPPEFKKLFSDMRVRPGSPCQFEVVVYGEPKPRVQWYFNNEPVVSQDYQISSVGDKHILYIQEVFDEDAGRFSVVAENDSGKSTCSALLVVVDESQVLPNEGSPPDTPMKTMAPQVPFTATPPKPVQPPPAPPVPPAPLPVASKPKEELTYKPVPKPLTPTAPAPKPLSPQPQLFKQEQVKPMTKAPAAYAPPSPRPTAPSPTYQEKIVQPVKAPVAARPAAPPAPPVPKQPPTFQQVDVRMELPVPPQFIQPLRNLAAEEGTRVTFEGIVKGKPEPTIKWFKSGKQISDSADFQISFREGRVMLSIPEVFEQDAGKYVCNAANKAGTVDSSAELIVKASMIPPEFPQKLQSKSVKEGDTVRFTVRVHGKPSPEVTWYREGSQIVSSPDFEIQQEGDLHTLYIPEVFYEDAGKFSVRAENRAGESLCSADLVVLAQPETKGPPAPPAPPAPPMPKSPIGVLPQRPAVYTPPQGAPPRKSPVFQPQVPVAPVPAAPVVPPPVPKFSKLLKDLKVREGHRAVLECHIPAYPAPDHVQWHRNEVEIHQSPDYEITYVNGVCTLIIAEVFPEDAGHFSCTVTISGVSNTTHMYLTVEAGPPPQPPRPIKSPVFEQELINQPLYLHQTAYFECRVDAYPPAEILWTRRGHPLVDKERYKSTYDQYNGVTTLTIYDLSPEDEGEYTCTAINDHGEASTSATLLSAESYRDWQRKEMADKERELLKDTVRAVPSPLPRTPTPTYTPTRAPASPYQKPMSDYDSDVPEGGFKVSNFEKRLMKEVEFREGRLDPKHHVPEAKEAFDVNVPLAQACAPIFEQKPKNFKLLEGSDATFVIKVAGNPTPHIAWYHNGRLIRPSNRYEMKMTKDGYVTLRIRVAFPEDTGHYTCCATNVVGRDTCSAELYIEGISEIDETSYIAPEALRRMIRSPDLGRRDTEPGGVSEKFFRPVFRKTPEDKECQEGQMVRFDCIVTGRPHPELFWYRDGVQVFDDNLHKIVINESGINSLIIHATTRFDNGQYTCVAKNRAGEASFTVHLNVAPRPAASAPRFIDRMQNQTVREGQPVSFHAQAAGVPPPMMSWQKDGQMITRNDHYRIESDSGKSSLYIDKTRHDDQAWYQCTAASIAGTASNRARLIVQVEARKPTPERRLSIPRRTITTPTKEITMPTQRRPSSEPMVMPIRTPTPETVKSRADIMLSPAPTPSPKQSPLPWRPVQAAVPAAPIQPVAAPPAPSPAISKPEPIRPTEVTLHMAAPSQPAAPVPKESDLLKYIKETERVPDAVDLDRARPVSESPRPSTKELILKGIEPEPDIGEMFNKEKPRPPKFKTQIRPQVDLTENQPAHFECRLVPIGDPDLVVEWYKDGKLLKAGHRFRPVNDFGYVALDIMYTFPEDNGTYTCTAVNKYGQDNTQAPLKCTGKESVIYETQLPDGEKSVQHLQRMEESIRREQIKKETIDVMPEPSAPLFDLKPEVIQVEEGDTAKFMCKISGHPRPRLTWWINGAIVVNSHRFRLVYDGMIHILEIPKVRDYDSGTIRVVAKNPLGEAECTTTLVVIPREDWRSRLKQAPKSTVEVELEKKKDVVLRSIELDTALRKPKTTVMEIRAFERSTQEKAMSFKDEEVRKATADINLQHTQMSRQRTYLEPLGRSESSVHIARARAMLTMPPEAQRVPFEFTVDKTKITQKEPPMFVKPLNNINVREGQVVKLEVQYTGYPTPEIQWFREGIEIKPSRDFQITTLNQKSFLVIPEVFLEDGGIYTVRAFNQFGMVECRCIITVVEDTTKVKDIPPEFRVQMRDITIRIGEPATFDCQINGHPRPDVYWAKDGNRLSESPRWKFIIEEEHYTLLIYEVRHEDQGLYECNVINKMGKATCSARLIAEAPAQEPPVAPAAQMPKQVVPPAQQAPQLVEPLRDVHVNEGEQVSFQCTIVAHPEPVVQWYYNNQIIKPSKYFMMRSRDGIHQLHIAGAFPEDEGMYKCTARNQAGEVTCIAHLRVNPLSSEPEQDLTKATEPPAFAVPLTNLTVVDGQQAVFEATVTGIPSPEVTWFREGHQITHSEDFQIIKEGQKCFLVIKEIFPEDSGIFTCRATNAAGVAECSALLTVEEPMQVSQTQMQLAQPAQAAPVTPTQVIKVKEPAIQKPKILKAPSPVREVFVGSTTKLLVELAAYPAPQIVWLLNGQQIKPSQRHKVTYEQNIASLMIYNVQPSDRGDYMMKAVNEAGQTACKTTLFVKPTEKIVELPTETKEATITAQAKAAPQKQVVPVFVKPLMPETRAKEKSVARLVCHVEAYPQAQITWLVNGVTIEPGPRYLMGIENQDCFLEIRNVTREDTGVYTCRAVSELGEAVSSTTLYVTVPEPPTEPPKFTKMLQNVTAPDGKEVTLSCVIQGQPQPEVSWFHNHKCIDKSEDFVITYDRQNGKIDLVIVDCLPDDQGVFKCVARNKAGQAVTECTLTVILSEKPVQAHPQAVPPKGPPPAQTKPSVAQPPQQDIKMSIRDQDKVITTVDVDTVDTTTTREVESKVMKKIVKRVSGQPPRFTKPIQPCVVKEGESCVFNATVVGAPQPEITWLKDKQDLILTPRHVPTFNKETGTCTLTISIAEQDDVGVYSCRATNPAGRATCTANVVVVPPDAEVTITEKTVSVKKEKVTIVGEQETRTVESSPTFSQTLMPVTEVNEGDSVKLECQVSAEPIPDVKWYFNDKEIISTQHITVTFEQGVTTLTITRVVIEDTGEYSCKAINPLGEGVTKTFLRIRRKEIVRKEEPMEVSEGPISEAPVAPEKGPKAARPPPEGPADVPPAPLSEPCAVIPMFPPEESAPRFTMPLRNLSTNDGDRAIFRVFFTGYPHPQITWYFNSQPIRPSADFQINVDIQRGESTLIIVEVYPEDEGEYMCKAVNPLGTAVTHCHLFVKLPSSSSEEEGVEKIVSKTVEVIKTEMPVDVRETRRFSETIAIDHKEKLQEMLLQFQLPQPRHERSEFFVRRQSLPKGIRMEITVPTTQVEQKYLTLKQKTEAITTQRQELMVPITMQRRFSETLAIDHKQKYREMQLQFKLPEPRIEKSSLLVQQKPALKGMKMQVEVPELRQRSQMRITQKQKAEAIETQRQELRMELGGSPPKFIWELQSLKVMDGEEAKMLCKVHGNPIPDITWYHNGKVIVENPDFRTYYSRDTGECLLHILEVFPQDTGSYECHAVNKYGKAVTKASILVEVYEYVPDSEEATASQTESYFSASSMDEAEFQAKTQRFLANMERIRKEITTDITTEYKEEVIEEMEIEEHGYEETIQMADVKWQIPQKAREERMRISPEKAEGIQGFVTEQPSTAEVTSEVATAAVEGPRPSQVLPQEAKAPQEAAEDLIAEGAAMMEQEEIKVEYSQPSVEGKKETLAAPVVEQMTPEEAEQLIAEAGQIMQEEEYKVELSGAVVEGKKETRVEAVQEKLPVEGTEIFTEAVTDVTKEEQISVDLARHTVQEKAESRVLVTIEKPSEEIVQDLIGEASEATQQQDYKVEFAQPDVRQKKETHVIAVEERASEEAFQELVEETTEKMVQHDVRIELAQPDIREKKETHVLAVEEKAPEEALQELSAETTETVIQHDVGVELAQPDVGAKKETRVIAIQQQAPEEVVQDLIGEASEATQQHDYVVEYAQPDVGQKKETHVLVVEEKPAEEGFQEIMEETTEVMTQHDVSVELAQPDVREKKVSHVLISEEKPVEEGFQELAEETTETTIQHDIKVDLTQPEITEKKETLVTVTEEQPRDEVLQELVEETTEMIIEHDIKVELAQPDVREKRETHAAVVEKRPTEETTEELVEEVTDTSVQQEIKVELAQPDVAEKRETQAAVVEKKPTEETLKDIAEQPEETTIQRDVMVELAQPDVEQKKESHVVVSEEQQAEEMLQEFAEEITETTIEHDIKVELRQPEVKAREETLVQVVQEEAQEEIFHELAEEVTESTKEEEIHVALEQPVAERKRATLAAEHIEKRVPEEVSEDVKVVPEETTEHEEVVVDMVLPEEPVTAESRVEPQLEQLPEESLAEIAHTETDLSKEEEIAQVELAQPVKEKNQETLVQTQEEKLSMEVTEVVGEVMEEKPSKEEICVDLAQHSVGTTRVSHVQAQMEKMSEEQAEDIIAELAKETPATKEITVELAQPSSESARETLTLTLEEHLAEENIEELLEAMPSPKATEGQEIISELAQPTVQEKKPSLAQQLDEQLSEGSVEENIEEYTPHAMAGEEVVADLTQPSAQSKAPTHVDIMEERHSEEEEEEIFYEAPEPPITGEEISVELAAADVRTKEQTLALTQEAKADVEVAEETVVAYSEELTKEQEVTVSLATAEKEAPKPALVHMQETLMTTLDTQELEAEDITRDVTQESQVQVDLETAAFEAPKPTQVSTQEETLDLQATREDIVEYIPEETVPEEIHVDLTAADKREKPLQLTKPVEEGAEPEDIAQEYIGSIKEVYMIPAECKPEYEPSVVERYRLETRAHPQAILRVREAAAEMQIHIEETQALETNVELMEKAAQEAAEVRRFSEIVEEREKVTETERTELEILTKEKVMETTRVITKEGMEISATSLMAPVFEIPLSDVTTSDGERAYLECRVTGTPQPEVTWYVDSQEIKPSQDFKILYEDGVCTLVIEDVLPEDEGEYTVKAVNEAGTCVTTAYLTVLPASASESEPTSPTEETIVARRHSGVRSERREKITEEFKKVEVDLSLKVKKEKMVRQEYVPSGPEAPKFVSQLEHKEIFESMPVKLMCEVIGFPEPEITWLQDGKKLTHTDHTQITYDKGLCTLFIDKVRLEDEAEYVCEARNELGVATTWAELLVEKLISAVEQVILEEYYQVEIEMHFKWKEPKQLSLPASNDDDEPVADAQMA